MLIENQLKQSPAFRNSAGFLSNFSPYLQHEYHIHEGISYPSNEHFYQAMKFNDPNIREQIAKHPAKGLKAFVRSLPNMRSDWDKVKLEIMQLGLTHKFNLPRFKSLLLQTGQLELVERNIWNDTFWGVCNEVGDNHLGKILMSIRDKLKP